MAAYQRLASAWHLAVCWPRRNVISVALVIVILCGNKWLICGVRAYAQALMAASRAAAAAAASLWHLAALIFSSVAGGGSWRQLAACILNNA